MMGKNMMLYLVVDVLGMMPRHVVGLKSLGNHVTSIYAYLRRSVTRQSGEIGGAWPVSGKYFHLYNNTSFSKHTKFVNHDGLIDIGAFTI